MPNNDGNKRSEFVATNSTRLNDAYTLSEYERLALSSRVNLSDGHARLPLSDSQRAIVGRTLELLDKAQSLKQENIEEEFIHSFFSCAGQNVSSLPIDWFLNFSSSSAIKIAAQYCRINNLTVYLLEPCFDNIYHLLTSEQVSVVPISEEQLSNLSLLQKILNHTTVLWLIQPNNPTGFCLNQDQFAKVVSYISKANSTLIVDFCFRFYAQHLALWSQYQVLHDSSINFICIEDTGKTWSLVDTKVGITICSRKCSDLIYQLHDELLLNVSPLHLMLLTEFITDTMMEGLAKTIFSAIDFNRNKVHSLVEKELVQHATEWCRNVPMELLGLPSGVSSKVVWSELRRRGIDILPAQNYFWSGQKEESSLFRIPLARPQRDIEIATPIIEAVLLDIKQHD